MLVFKKSSFKCLQNQGILATLFTTSRTVLYFACIFMLNGKQLLNKTDTQNVPKKCLVTLRMTRVFINVWMNMVVLLLKFSWSWYKLAMNWKTVNTYRTFRIEFKEWLCPQWLSTPGSLTDSSINLGGRNKGFLMVPSFP